MFEFKKLNIDSSRELSKLCMETFAQAYGDVHAQKDIQEYCEKNYAEASITELLRSGNALAVAAYSAAQAAGFYILKHHPCPIGPDDPASELKQIYVLSTYYGKGLGLNLFAHAKDRAKLTGSKRLWLCVSDINYRAQAFYDKIGFDTLGPGPLLVVGEDSLSSTVMALEL